MLGVVLFCATSASGNAQVEPPTLLPLPERHANATATLRTAGQHLNWSLPEGWCLPGSSERERLAERVSRDALLKQHVLPLAWAAPCRNLAAWSRNEIPVLDRWLQIQQLPVGPRRELLTVRQSRQEYLIGVARSFNHPVDIPRAANRITEAFESAQIKLNAKQITALPIGSDGMAYYLAMSFVMEVDGVKSSVRGLAGITLVQGVPLQVVVYESRIGLTPTLDQLQWDILSRILLSN